MQDGSEEEAIRPFGFTVAALEISVTSEARVRKSC